VRPNVVLVLTDDQSYGDFGLTGNPVLETPHMDSLAESGAFMDAFYVTPLCSPTRASILTGRYNYRTRAIHVRQGRAMLAPDEVTLAELLGAAGYRTAIFGKWHLGENHPMRPIDQGFDESLVHLGARLGSGDGPDVYTDPVLRHNGTWVEREGYATEIFFDAAMAWIEERARAQESFFVFLPTNVPHRPHTDVPAEEYARYRELLQRRDIDFDVEGGHPLEEPADSVLDEWARVYAMLADLDAHLGRLLAKLDELELARDTIVVYLSDNGGIPVRYSGGFRGRKANVYEGGIRTPLLVRWPAGIPEPLRTDRIGAHVDLLPTVLDACGVPVPEGLELDGTSLLPLLTGAVSADEWPDRELFFQSMDADVPERYFNVAVRGQRWKLVNGLERGEELPAQPRFELFDLEADPFGRVDVAAAHPEVVAELRAAYDAWFDDVGSSRRDAFEPPRIHLGTPHENPVLLSSVTRREDPGHWEVHVAEEGEYAVEVLIPDTVAPGSWARLTVGEIDLEQRVPEGAGPVRFERVRLPRGDARLAVGTRRRQGSKRERRVYSVEVTRLGEER
jgi:arylsulfatase/arylsulfatase A